MKNQIRNEFRRLVHPKETIEYIKTGLKKLDLQEDLTIVPVYDNLWTVRLIIPALKAGSNGKGINAETAIASAYGEFIERLSSIEIGIDIGPYRQLYGKKGNVLGRVTLYKHMNGYRWAHEDCVENAVTSRSLLRNQNFNRTQLETLKDGSELLRHWIKGRSLLHNKDVYVPILFTKWISATNGLASGNTMEEAIVHGCCEIFERHAMINFLKSGQMGSYPVINVESIDNDLIKSMVETFRKKDVDVHILDIGRGIYPVYAIITRNNKLGFDHINFNTMKAGCSFDTDDAIIRCFTERIQGTSFEYEMTENIRINRDNPDKFMPLFFKGVCPFDLGNCSKCPTKNYERSVENDVHKELEKCIAIVEKLGTDLVIVDHTHPILKFPTVRVIMPGVSDFIDWWDPGKVTLDLIGNLNPAEDQYEEKLIEVLESFIDNSPCKRK
jgi:YcaO-like protein with predicted kinase domain